MSLLDDAGYESGSYVVNPDTRQIERWQDGSLHIVPALLTLPAAAIWNELDRRLNLPPSSPNQ